jgi:TolA-binding protein
MSEERLDEAFRAMRAEVSGEADEADRTLARVLATRRAKEDRRRRTWMYLLPIAAVLAGSTAWAAASGRVSSLWEVRSPSTTEVAVNDAPAPTSTPAMSAPSMANTAADAVETEPTRDEKKDEEDTAKKDPTSEEAPPKAMATTIPHAKEPSIRGDAASAQPAASASPIASAAAPPKFNPLAEDKADFQAAYRIHAGASPAAAVDAWNGYLGKHPNGRFVPEARYARAVALVRSGQSAAAREALRPFAESSPGGYRREDARQLLESLGH